MSDTDPRSSHPDNRHQLGALRGATTSNDDDRVLELHAAQGSATIRIPHDKIGALLDVVRDLDADPLGPELQTCPVCGMVGLPERITNHDCPLGGDGR